MAVADVSIAGSTGSTLGVDDYSLYSNMTDEELIQVAIERSLADAQASAPSSWACQGQPNRHPRCCINPNPNPANPPSEKQCTEISRDAQNHNFCDNGKEVVASRKQEYSFIQVTEQFMEDMDPMDLVIWKGDSKALSEMVKYAATRLCEPNKDGWVPLHDAAYYGQVECVEILFRAQPEVINRRSRKSHTPLQLAVVKQHVDCVQCLLERGADPNIPNTDGETPLYRACEKGNEEIVELLLKFGANATQSDMEGLTPLHEAVRNRKLKICHMLLQAGAKLFAKSIYGIDPIFTAAQSGAVQEMDFLIKKGANINSQAHDGASALYEASKNGHEKVVELLLLKKAEVNKSNKAGLFPLHVAAKNGHDGIVSMLVPHTNRASVLHSGISPLHLAAEHNRDDILEILIEAGFDVNATLSIDWSNMYEDRRSTALYFAVVNSNLEAAAMLLEAGANPNLDTFNPLLVAARKGFIEMVTLLVEHGANVNAYTPTPPMSFPTTVMFSMKHLPMLKYLMDNGCDALSCFKCVYGSNPHPPIKITRSDRDDLRYSTDTPQNTCMQFCEVISCPSISHWAGTIIDVLLNYVGHVKLCARLTEHLDSYEEWAKIKEKSMPPRPLMQLCRLKICQQLGNRRHINTLPLPGRLIKYLNHDEKESLAENFLT